MDEFVELYIKDLDPNVISEIYSVVKGDREALEPELQTRDDGRSVIMIGFRNHWEKRRFVDRLSGNFPGKIDWR